MSTVTSTLAVFESSLKSGQESQPSQMQRFDLVFSLTQLIPLADKSEVVKTQPRIEAAIFASLQQTSNRSLRVLLYQCALLVLKHGATGRVQELVVESLRIARDPKSTELTKV